MDIPQIIQRGVDKSKVVVEPQGSNTAPVVQVISERPFQKQVDNSGFVSGIEQPQLFDRVMEQGGETPEIVLDAETTKSRIIERYDNSRSVEISHPLEFECLKELLFSGSISTMNDIKAIRVGKGLTVEDTKNVVDYFLQNAKELKQLEVLIIEQDYKGWLVIPTFENLRQLEIGKVIGRLEVSENQPCLKALKVEEAGEFLIIKSQNQLEFLEIFSLINQNIDLQPNLKRLHITVCSCDIELQDFPSLVEIIVEKNWYFVTFHERLEKSPNVKITNYGRGMSYGVKLESFLF